MNCKHTPGPWRIKTATIFNNPEENNNLIEYKWVGFGAIGDETPVLARHLKENEANARLIAAAPELLEALALIISDIYSETGPEPLVQYMDSKHVTRALNALKKARGEP